jgi:hypothetical protein
MSRVESAMRTKADVDLSDRRLKKANDADPDRPFANCPSSSASVERASLTSTWPRRFIVLTRRLSARCSGVSNAGAPAL